MLHNFLFAFKSLKTKLSGVSLLKNDVEENCFNLYFAHMVVLNVILKIYHQVLSIIMMVINIMMSFNKVFTHKCDNSHDQDMNRTKLRRG